MPDDPFSAAERAFVDRARVGRLATADADGRPHVVPVCYALLDSNGGRKVVTPVDEKPKTTTELRRVRDVRENPRVALIIDRYVSNWSQLGWVQIRGRASVVPTDGEAHGDAVQALRGRYEQYVDHELETRPIIQITPGRVLSWGDISSG